MSNKKRIFIADDDEVILTSLKKLLVLSGFEVETTQKAKDIISKIKVFKPDVILLDLVMPNLGGMEVCEMLNQDKQTCGIPIIVVSGLSKLIDQKKAYRLGVIGYFTKPYDFPKLLKEINKAIAYKEGRIT
jgi:DNA-binding response OmpR family regulator